MSIDQVANGGNFDMGRVISRTFTAVGKHAMILVPPAVAVSLVSQLITGFATLGTDPASLMASPLYWLTLIGTVMSSFILQGFIIHVVADGYRGNQPSIAKSFAAAIKHLLPLIATGLLVFVVSCLGLFLLLVPGLILFVMWSVAVPAVMIEGVGPLKAMGRSRALTKGARWQIFGLGIAVIVIIMLLSFGIYGFNITAMVAAGATFDFGRVMLGTLVGAITSVLMYAGIAAIYSELRMIKEGVSNDQLAAAFD